MTASETKWNELLPFGLAPELLDAVPYPVFVLGDELRLRGANAAARERFGLAGDALAGPGGELPALAELREQHYARWRNGESPRPMPLRWEHEPGSGSFLSIPFPMPGEAGVYAILLLPDGAPGAAREPRAPKWLVSGELEAAARRDAAAIRELDARRRDHEGFSQLTTREWEIARRIAAGDRVSLLAEDLRISPNTVRNHLKAIFRKLGVRSQPQLVRTVRTLARARSAAGA